MSILYLTKIKTVKLKEHTSDQDNVVQFAAASHNSFSRLLFLVYCATVPLRLYIWWYYYILCWGSAIPQTHNSDY